MVSVLGLLVVGFVVWVVVASASNQQLGDTQLNSLSHKRARPQETQGPAEARGETGAEGQAKSRQALEEDLEAQENFKAGTEKSRQVLQEDVPAQENFKSRVAPDNGEEKKERPSVAATQMADNSTLSTVKTCRCGTIELNAAEKRLLDLHNQTHTGYGLPPLCVRPDITDAARTHSQDMLNKYFSLILHPTAPSSGTECSASVTPSVDVPLSHMLREPSLWRAPNAPPTTSSGC